MSRGDKIVLPVDVVVTTDLKGGAASRSSQVDSVNPNEMIVDIGPQTAEVFGNQIRAAGTVLWNGPMGVFEFDAFAAGTEAVGQAIVDSGAVSVVGGGDSAAAAHKLGFADKMTHISTGGGATLEYIEGKELPGVAALRSSTRA